jgi:hypothetical protein
LRKAIPEEQKVGVGMDGYNLNLQSYCSYCKDFSPVLEQTDVTCYSDSRKKYMNDISCENKDRCEQMMEMLKDRC